MKKIPLTQGKVALIDDLDYEKVKTRPWYAHKVGKRWYAATASLRVTGRKGIIHLHKFLIPDAFWDIDHEDGNGLNCQRYNLRPCSRLQNTRGYRRKRLGVTSHFRGVSWRKDRKTWTARIKVGGKSLALGSFDAELSAAKAYDVAARKYFGDFASPNFTT